jgi:hypothetical protein
MSSPLAAGIAFARVRRMARKNSAATRKTGVKKRSTKARVPARRQASAGRAGAPKAPARTADRLLAPLKGADRREVAGVVMEIGRAGDARVKRVIYPVGFRWSTDMKPITGTELCMHAHVGFLARGEIRIDFGDGCVAHFKAPQIVSIEPGHDGRVVGREPAVLIEFDFEQETVRKLGLPDQHRH